MAVTPEGKVKKRVKKILDQYKPVLYYYMPVPSGYGESTLDFVGCMCGLFFTIETKREGGLPTQRQGATMERISAARGIVFVIAGEDDTQTLEQWLTEAYDRMNGALYTLPTP